MHRVVGGFGQGGQKIVYLGETPTGERVVVLAQCAEDHRQLYDAALEHRRTLYRKAGVRVRYGDQSAELRAIRADDTDGQGRWSFSSRQATLRRLDTLPGLARRHDLRPR